MKYNKELTFIGVMVIVTTVFNSVNGNNCTTEEFICKNGTCIDIDRVCDNSFECPDNSDESNCTTTTCPEGLTKCLDGTCRYNCLVTTIELATTNIKSTTTDEVNPTTDIDSKFTTQKETQSTEFFIVRSSTIDSESISSGGGISTNSISIPSNREPNNSSDNNLYFLFLLIILPIIMAVFIARYKESMRDFIYHLKKERKKEKKDNAYAIKNLA